MKKRAKIHKGKIVPYESLHEKKKKKPKNFVQGNRGGAGADFHLY